MSGNFLCLNRIVPNDVYGLGMVLLGVLTGTRSYGGVACVRSVHCLRFEITVAEGRDARRLRKSRRRQPVLGNGRRRSSSVIERR